MPIDKICECCGKLFRVKPFKKDSKYCSFECYKPSIKIDNDLFAEYYANHTSVETAKYFDITVAQVRKHSRRIQLPRKTVIWKDHPDLTLTAEQSEIINGSLLGDGYLFKLENPGDNSRFDEGHCFAQQPWLQWKYDRLVPFSKKLIEEHRHSFSTMSDGRILKNEGRCMFATIRHPIFTQMERQWYKRDEEGNYVLKQVSSLKHRIKIVPTDLQLTPLTVAVWYMDDGSHDYEGRRCHLFPLGFTYEEVDSLICKLRNLGIVHCFEQKTPRPGQFVIYISRESYLPFIEMVQSAIPDLPQAMHYKVDLSKYRPVDYSTQFSKASSSVPRRCAKVNKIVIEAVVADAAEKKFTQREIAKRHGLNYKEVNSILKGQKYHYAISRGDSIGSLNYRNKTGINNVYFNNRRKVYMVRFRIGKDKLSVHCGQFKNLEDAKFVANQAEVLRKQRILDAVLYKAIKKEK